MCQCVNKPCGTLEADRPLISTLAHCLHIGKLKNYGSKTKQSNKRIECGSLDGC